MEQIHLPFVSNSKCDGLDIQQFSNDCFMLLKHDPSQMRKTIIRNEILMSVAQKRADDMSIHNYFSHTDPGGFGPNWHVKKAGYKLPDWYPSASNSNSIESIGGNIHSPSNFIDALKNSPGHRAHILGLHEFYREQIYIGIGIAYRKYAKYNPIWVIITCPKE